MLQNTLQILISVFFSFKSPWLDQKVEIWHESIWAYIFESYIIWTVYSEKHINALETYNAILLKLWKGKKT